ncbi:MAG: Hsp20/alpha crystallin family protein [Myxococcales bacterium]|jgi:HSP20 family protein
MAITRWEKELSRLHDELNRMFDDRMFRLRLSYPTEEDLGAGFYPPVDIYEDAEGVTITAEVPGIEPKDVDLRIENNVLTLRGERKLEREDKRDNYRRIERAYGIFSRSFTLPPTVDSDKVKAEAKNGLLVIHLPKREETKPRTIKVNVE